MNKHKAVVYSEGKLSHKFLALLTYIWERYFKIAGGVQLQLWGHNALGECLSGWDPSSFCFQFRIPMYLRLC